MLYDVLVIGGGPAGITAAVYVKRANKSVAILEKFAPGGQINLLGKVENYLGFTSVEGSELAQAFSSHAKQFNIPFIYEEAKEYDLEGDVKKVFTRKNVYEAKTIIFALGSHTIPLGITNEDRYKGRGLSYCAMCDGNFFKGGIVAVVGSGKEAISDSIYLSGLCEKVYLVSNKQIQDNNVINNNNVEVVENAQASEVVGDATVTGLKIIQDGKEKTLKIDGVFIAIGRKPDTPSLEGKVELNPHGYIKASNNLHTSVEGVFACGDVREDSMKQICVAVGEGAIAGTEALKYIAFLNAKNSSK